MASYKAPNCSDVKMAHVVCLPYPTQSHIGAMLRFAKLLHHRGHHITFVNTEYNHRRLLEARGGLGCTDDLLTGFRFVTIPDGLPKSDANATQDLRSLRESHRRLMAAPFEALVGGLVMNESADSSSGFPPNVSFIVADGFMTYTVFPAADKFGIPVVNLWTIPACALMALMYIPELKEKGFIPLKDEGCLTNGFLEATINWIPSMKNIKLRQLPAIIWTRGPDEINFLENTVARNDKAMATIFHTFDALEPDILTALSSRFSGPVYGIGPFQLLLNRIPENENHLKHVGSNLWKEDTQCLRWLDSQEPKSVVYVNFGSIVSVTNEQLVEFAMGLANSKHRFLWIIRPDLVSGEEAILPPEFIEGMAERGFVCEWCPQEEVLGHPSVGGFLTHCGWNSVIESLSSGVPMLCWPRAGDQPTNCRYVCTEWEAGLEIDGEVKRDQVERLVKELMGGEKGKVLRNRAMEWKKLAMEAAGSNGSSSINLDKLFDTVLSTST